MEGWGSQSWRGGGPNHGGVGVPIMEGWGSQSWRGGSPNHGGVRVPIMNHKPFFPQITNHRTYFRKMSIANKLNSAAFSL